MGIFTKRKYLTDSVSFITQMRLFGRRYGLYSIFAAMADLSEEDKKQVNTLGVHGSEKAAYYRIQGYKRLFKNEIFYVDYFDSKMELFATALTSDNTRAIKYYDKNEDGSLKKAAHVIVYDTRQRSGYHYTNMSVNSSTTDPVPIHIVNSTKHYFNPQKTLAGKAKDEDIVSIERIMNFDMVHTSNRPKTDLVTITYGNDRSTTLVVSNADNSILMAQALRPNGEFIYVFKPEVLNYGEGNSTFQNIEEDKETQSAIDSIIELRDPVSTLVRGGNRYEFSSTMVAELMKEVKEGSFPNSFIGEVVTHLT